MRHVIAMFLVLSVGCSAPNGYSGPPLDAPAACAADRALCNGACVNLLADGQNCGACGSACPAGSGCAGGVCVGGCAAPRVTCAGTCTDTSSDPRNCGACANTCFAGENCLAGSCVSTSTPDAGLDVFVPPSDGGACTPANLGSALGGGVARGTTVGRSSAHTPPASCTSQPTAVSPDALFTWTAPFGGTFVFDTVGSSFDTMLTARSGSCSGPALDCNDDIVSGTNTASRLTLALSAGQTLLLALEGFGTESGAFVLNVTAGGASDASVRNCSGRECGPDGVGGSCGTCSTAGWGCNLAGRCVPPDMVCMPACAGRECGADPGLNCAGRTCGTCAGGSVCNASGRCACVPNCAGRVCGNDGCGGSCGACAIGRTCNSASGQCEASSSCVSACGGRMCGADPGPGCAGRTCGACPRGFACNATGTACPLDRNSLWVVTVVSGTVSARDPAGELWDPDGVPDPSLCLTINGATACTTPTTPTFAPVWNNRAPATAASNLLAGIQSSYVDVDDAFDDDICAPGPIRFTEANFNGAPVRFNCDPYGSFTLSLSPAP